MYGDLRIYIYIKEYEALDVSYLTMDVYIHVVSELWLIYHFLDIYIYIYIYIHIYLCIYGKDYDYGF